MATDTVQVPTQQRPGVFQRIRQNWLVDSALWMTRHYLRQHVKLVALAFVLTLISAQALALLAWLIAPAINSVATSDDSGMIWLIPLAIMGCVSVNGAALYASVVINEIVSQRVLTALQKDIFGAILRADLRQTSGEHTGRMIAMCTAEAGRAMTGLSQLAIGIVRDGVTFLFLAGVMVLRDWVLALIALSILPVFAFGLYSIGRKIRRRVDKVIEVNFALTALVTDVLQGLRLVKVSGTTEYERIRHARLTEQRQGRAIKVTRAKASTRPLNEITGGAAIAAVILLTAVQASTGGPDAFASLASFLTAVFLAQRPLKRLGEVFGDVQEGMVAVSRIRGLFDMRPTIVDKPGAVELAAPGLAPGEPEAGVVFENVRFRYRDGPDILKGVSLEIPKGKVTALVGPSGSGKSTLINLISRLYDIPEGSIRIDGHDVKDATVNSVRAAVALVSQETFLFDDTVAANIAYGVMDPSQDDIVIAAKRANAHGFIEHLPEGYATRVGERGCFLSGGQRQRVALARALLRQTPILLMDEPTASLDRESGEAIRNAVTEAAQDRAVLVVDHRLPAVRYADRIYVMVDGAIVEAGTHDELSRLDGVYAKLFAIQTLEDEFGRKLSE